MELAARTVTEPTRSPPAAVGGNGEFAQGVHGRPGAQGAVVTHFQIRGEFSTPYRAAMGSPS